MRQHDRLAYVLLATAAIVVAILALPWIPKGLEVPPGRGTLFGLVTAVVVIAVVACVAQARHHFARLPPKRFWLWWAGVPTVALVVLVFVYRFLEGRTLVHFDNEGYDSQPSVVFLPICPSKDLKFFFDRRGGRQGAVDFYLPKDMRAEAEKKPLRLLVTEAILLSCHVAIFSLIALALSTVIANVSNPRSRTFLQLTRAPPPPPRASYDAFVCHAGSDAPIAQEICDALEKSALHCWIAPRDVPVGADWAGAIVEGIRSSRTLVFIYTENANRSPHVERELAFATETRIPILQLRFDDVPARKELEYFTKVSHWMTATYPLVPAELERVAEQIRALSSGDRQAEIS